MTLLEQVRRCRIARDALISNSASWKTWLDSLEALDLAALEAALVDAERYRWLRESQSVPADILLNHHDALDTAIDKARAK